MHQFDLAAFSGFFTAVTSAAAALAGLLFVAVSINLAKILDIPGLPGRAAETLSVLVFVVLSMVLPLVPQDVELLGAEILAMAVPLAVVTVAGTLRYRREHPEAPLTWTVSRLVTSAIALVPATLGGASLAAHWGGGLYWLVPTALLGIGSGVFSAWILLVEILR